MSKFYSARRVVIYELEGNKIPIIKSIIDTNLPRRNMTWE